MSEFGCHIVMSVIAIAIPCLLLAGMLNISNQLEDRSLVVIYFSRFGVQLMVSLVCFVFSLRHYIGEIKNRIYRDAVEEVKREMTDGHIPIDDSGQ